MILSNIRQRRIWGMMQIFNGHTVWTPQQHSSNTAETVGVKDCNSSESGQREIISWNILMEKRLQTDEYPLRIHYNQLGLITVLSTWCCKWTEEWQSCSTIITINSSKWNDLDKPWNLSRTETQIWLAWQP